MAHMTTLSSHEGDSMTTEKNALVSSPEEAVHPTTKALTPWKHPHVRMALGLAG